MSAIISPPGGTLDHAYDFNGPGAGRTVVADSGPLEIVGTGSTACLRLGGTGMAHIEFVGLVADPAVSAAGEAKLIYNSTLNQFRASLNGAAYTPFGSGSGGSLQDAYDFTPSGAITLSAAGGPIALTNPIAAVQNAFTINQNAPQSAASINQTNVGFNALDTFGGQNIFTNNAATGTHVLQLAKQPAAAQIGNGLDVQMGANSTGQGAAVSMTTGATGYGSYIQQPNDTDALNIQKTFPNTTAASSGIRVDVIAGAGLLANNARIGVNSSLSLDVGDVAGSATIAYLAGMNNKPIGTGGSAVGFAAVGFAGLNGQYDVFGLSVGNDMVLRTQNVPFLGPVNGYKVHLVAGDGQVGPGNVGGDIRFTAGAKSDPTALDGQILADTFSSVVFTQQAQTTGSPSLLTLTGAAHTTLTASVEAPDVYVDLARTVEFDTGALATQRALRVLAPAYAFVAASTITDAATVAINGAPQAGTNATITNAYSLWVESGNTRLSGNVGVNQVPATDAQLAITDSGLATYAIRGTTTVAGGFGPAQFVVDAASSAAENVVTMLYRKTGGSVVGDGPGILLAADNAAGTNNVWSGITGRVQDPTAGAENSAIYFYTTNLGAFGLAARIYEGRAFELGPGSTAPVSAASTGAIRYNEISNQFQQSLNGAAWTSFGGGGGSLQNAYDFVPSGAITLSTAGGALAISNPGVGGVAGTAFTVTQNVAAQLSALFTGGSISIPDSGANSNRIGVGTTATGARANAFGDGSSANFDDACIVGQNSTTTGTRGVGLGNSVTTANNSVVAGYFSSALFNESTVLGAFSSSVSGASFVGGFSATSNGAQSVVIGNSAVGNSDGGNFPNNTLIGHATSNKRGNEVIVGASASSQSTVGLNVIVGTGASISLATVTAASVFGHGASTSAINTVVAGHGASAAGVNSIAVGKSATAGHDDVIVWGRGATSTGTNMLVVGSSLSSITAGYFGQGVSSASAITFTMTATNGQGVNGSAIVVRGGTTDGGVGGASTFGGSASVGTDQAGSTTTVAAGTGTGSGTAGLLHLQVAPSTSTGTTAHTLQNQVTLRGSTTAATPGDVILNNTGSAVSTSANFGFTYLPNMAGAPTGTPTAATGATATVVDTAAPRLFAYVGSWIPVGQDPVSVKTANYTIVGRDSTTLYTNEGAAGTITLTLPTPVAGLEYTFVVVTNQTLTVAAAGTDVIQFGTTASSAGGSVSATAVGSTWRLKAVNGTTWFAMSIVGGPFTVA